MQMMLYLKMLVILQNVMVKWTFLMVWLH